MRLNKFLILIGLLFTLSCVDRFIPETTRYDEVLFIECLISNDITAGSAIRISSSAPVATESGGKITFKPKGLSGAEVLIRNTDNKEVACIETIKGTYVPPPDFHVENSVGYKLVVIFKGNTYESDIQSLKSAPPIDSISYKPVMDKLSEDGEPVHGYRFYVSTHDSGLDPTYYRWSMEATFQYTVPYIATHIWNGRTTVVASNKLIRTCWKTKNIPGIFFAKTAGLAENRIINAPLNFESQNGDELSIRYSLNVKQYSISESAMVFWENIDKLINQTGSLYETQPYQIEGNIHCTSDPSLYVAGIFEVAGVSVMRTFVDKPVEFPVIPVRCILMTVGVDIPWYRLPAGSYVTQDYVSNTFLTATPSCYDCRLREGTTDKPPFWEGLAE